MKVKITSSVSSKLRDKRIEINEEFCRTRGVHVFLRGNVQYETQDAYHIIPDGEKFLKGIWVAKEHVTVLPDAIESLDRWV